MNLAPKDLKILIAEDHFPVRQMIGMVLRTKNAIEIDNATNGKQARDMLESAYGANKPYHIVFLDWDMPVMPGIDVLKHFRQQPAFANTAFVMVTAMSVQAQVLDAVKSGATAYMIKPVSQAAIGKKFDEVMIWLKQMNIKDVAARAPQA